jgi:hypothetical protein
MKNFEELSLKEINQIILSDPDRRKETAYHEAGHAVLYLKYCEKLEIQGAIDELSIKPIESENLAFIRIKKRLFWEFELQYPSEILSTREKVIRLQIQYLLAGHVVEFLLFNQDELLPDHFFDYLIDESSDLDKAIRLAKYFGTTTIEGLLPYFEATIQDVEKCLDEVRALGDRLLKEEEIYNLTIDSLP